MKQWLKVGSLALMALALGACNGGSGGSSSGTGGGGSSVSGTANIDGSSTVAPIAKALLESFAAENPDARVTVNEAGTGAGMDKFVRGEIEIATASRPIKQEEIDRAKEAGIEFIELPIAYDGICIVVHPENDWIESISIEELGKLWAPNSAVKTWADLRPGLPATEISLYGPTDVHGTFEYFNEVVNGDGKTTRTDYNQNAEYSPLVAGVAGDKNALGYVGFAYYESNKDKLKALAIVTPNGDVVPSAESIADGTYTPLARPLFLYVNAAKLENPVVAAFLEFSLSSGAEAVRAVNYIPLPPEAYELAKSAIAEKRTGSVFFDAKPGMTYAELLERERK